MTLIEIGQAVLGKYQELHDQNKELRESISLETLKRTEMVKKEQDESAQLRRDLQSMERKLLHSSSKNESLELQLRQIQAELDHQKTLEQQQQQQQQQQMQNHKSSKTTNDDEDEEKRYFKSQSEVLQMKLELLQQKLYNTTDKLG